MIGISCKQILSFAISKILVATFSILSFFSINSAVLAQDVGRGLSSTVGIASATVIANNFDVENPDSPENILFEIPQEYAGYFVKNNRGFNDWQIIYKIQSEPNTLLDISYRDKKLLNENYEVINGVRYLVLDLQNPNGEVIKARLKVDKNVMFFDDSGREDLALNPEIILKNKKQDKGTYRALYYIVVSY